MKYKTLLSSLVLRYSGIKRYLELSDAFCRFKVTLQWDAIVNPPEWLPPVSAHILITQQSEPFRTYAYDEVFLLSSSRSPLTQNAAAISLASQQRLSSGDRFIAHWFQALSISLHCGAYQHGSRSDFLIFKVSSFTESKNEATVA